MHVVCQNWKTVSLTSDYLGFIYWEKAVEMLTKYHGKNFKNSWEEPLVKPGTHQRNYHVISRIKILLSIYELFEFLFTHEM